MDPDIEDRVADWPSRTVSDGYEGLRKLADADFSGAVSLDGTWVFVVSGQVVGIRDGTIEDIEGTSGTAYQAPADALPLLFTMQSAGDTEVRGQYYTEETPLGEVDGTLQEAGFTGYLELSENVLSGDYYVVYHGGQSRSVAIVGTREEVLQGKEAYELAADEVGIYDVVQAPITVTEIPEPTEDDGAAVGGAAGGFSGSGTGGGPQTSDPGPGPDGSDPPSDGTAASASEQDSANADEKPRGEQADTAGQATESPEKLRQDQGASSADEDTVPSDTDHPPEGQGDGDSGAESGDSPTSVDTDPGSEGSTARGTEPGGGPDSLEQSSDEPTGAEAAKASSADESAEANENALRARVESLERELENEHQRAESLASERSDLSDQVDALKDDLEEVQAERDELTERVNQLEAQLATDGEQATDDRTDRPFREAMQETNLFVRYQTRSEPTLTDIQQGLDRDRLRDNLEVEVHTEFDRSTVSIDGVPFEDALRSSPEWSFVNWLVRDLPFEIRDTGQTDGLRGLMNAIPNIDRIDLQSAVEIAGGEQQTEATVQFDLILRNKTGAPLVVADIHHGREPVRGDSIDDLIARSGQVISGHEELSTAFAISPSFFSPDALEAAQAATSSGFLSRDSRLSYVKTDRSRGYHLCLVESRADAFHVTVPEL